MKKRKTTTVTVEVNGVKHRKVINYYTINDFNEKRNNFIKELEDADNPTFKTIAEDWWYSHTPEIKSYTVNCYLAPYNDLLKEFGDYKIQEINPILFQKYLDLLEDEMYALQTIKLRKIVMSQILDYAVINGYIISNNIRICKTKSKIAKTKRVPPDDNEIKKIKNNSDGVFGLFANILLYTGMRKGEVLALTYEDIDFKNKKIMVNKTIVFENARAVVTPGTKSEAGNRVIPLMSPLEKLLNRFGKGYIICNKDGEPLNKGEFDRGFKKYKEAIGISCTAHQLRHYFATACFDAGLEAKDAQKILGHADLSTTQEIYTHISKSREEINADKLQKFFEN